MACKLSKEEKEMLAKAEFERKVSELKAERERVCYKNAFAEAELLADSIVRTLQINPLGDSLYRPEIPQRPDFVPTDSIEVNSKRSVKPIIGP